MKFKISFKTPDAMEQVYDLPEFAQENARDFMQKYMKYGEYITIEFDTEAKTAVAVPVS